VKLTDFGLEWVRAGGGGEEEEEGGGGHHKDHAFWRRRLWTAPELISLEFSPRWG